MLEDKIVGWIFIHYQLLPKCNYNAFSIPTREEENDGRRRMEEEEGEKM